MSYYSSNLVDCPEKVPWGWKKRLSGSLWTVPRRLNQPSPNNGPPGHLFGSQLRPLRGGPLFISNKTVSQKATHCSDVRFDPAGVAYLSAPGPYRTIQPLVHYWGRLGVNPDLRASIMCEPPVRPHRGSVGRGRRAAERPLGTMSYSASNLGGCTLRGLTQGCLMAPSYLRSWTPGACRGHTLPSDEERGGGGVTLHIIFLTSHFFFVTY